MSFKQRIVPCCDISGNISNQYCAIPTKEYDVSIHFANGDLPAEEITDQKELLSPRYEDLRLNKYRKNGRR